MILIHLHPRQPTTCPAISSQRLGCFIVCRLSLAPSFRLASIVTVFLQKCVVCGSPSSSNITDAMSQYLKPSFQHFPSHMNLGPCHPTVLLTELETKLNSSLFPSMSSFNYHDLYSSVSADSLRATAFLFFCAQHCSHKLCPPPSFPPETLQSKSTPTSFEHLCTVVPARPASPSEIWIPDTVQDVSENLHSSVFTFPTSSAPQFTEELSCEFPREVRSSTVCVRSIVANTLLCFALMCSMASCRAGYRPEDATTPPMSTSIARALRQDCNDTCHIFVLTSSKVVVHPCDSQRARVEGVVAPRRVFHGDSSDGGPRPHPPSLFWCTSQSKWRLVLYMFKHSFNWHISAPVQLETQTTLTDGRLFQSHLCLFLTATHQRATGTKGVCDVQKQK